MDSVIIHFKRLLCLSIFLLGCAFAAQSQQTAPFSQSQEVLNYYNPAAAGRSGNLDIMALYRLNWMGWNNAPMTLFATADMPFRFMKREHGIGIVLFKDIQSSVFDNMTIGLQYAYLKKIKSGTLRVGLQAGLISYSAKGEETITPSQNLTGDSIAGGGDDEAIPKSKTDAKTFDANFGIYYGNAKWYVSLAAMHLLEPEIDDEDLQFFFEREYNFAFGYNIKTKNPLIELQPSVFVNTNFNAYRADLTAKAVFMRRFNAGLTWQMSDASFSEGFAILLGAKFNRIQAGYAYNFPLSHVRMASSGSHELYLKYSLQLNKPKTGKSKHKSVRLL